MSILLVTPDLNYGGEENRVVNFANEYIKHFKHVFVIGKEGKLSKHLSEEVIYFNYDVASRNGFLQALRKIISIRPTIIQGHKRGSLFFLKSIELLKLCKYVNFNIANQWPSKNILLYLLPKYVISLASELSDHFSKYLSNKEVEVILMGGELNQEGGKISHREEKKKLRIATLGKFSKQKNQIKIIETLFFLPENEFEFIFIGDGEFKNYCEEKVPENQKEYVVFLGYRKDVFEQLCTVDAYLQVSIFEGFPNALIEAASCGLPLIATNVGATPQIVEDNGILIDKNISPKELSKVLLDFKRDYKQYKDKAQEKINFFGQKFSKDRMIKDYIRYYEKLSY